MKKNGFSASLREFFAGLVRASALNAPRIGQPPRGGKK